MSKQQQKTIAFPKESHAQVKAFCDKHGFKMTVFAMSAIQEKMSRHEEMIKSANYRR
ncbi:MAG: hypothetical protein ACRCZZ_10855 [Phocaeicola sp.]